MTACATRSTRQNRSPPAVPGRRLGSSDTVARACHMQVRWWHSTDGPAAPPHCLVSLHVCSIGTSSQHTDAAPICGLDGCDMDTRNPAGLAPRSTQSYSFLIASADSTEPPRLCLFGLHTLSRRQPSTSYRLKCCCSGPCTPPLWHVPTSPFGEKDGSPHGSQLASAFLFSQPARHFQAAIKPLILLRTFLSPSSHNGCDVASCAALLN